MVELFGSTLNFLDMLFWWLEKGSKNIATGLMNHKNVASPSNPGSPENASIVCVFLMFFQGDLPPKSLS